MIRGWASFAFAASVAAAPASALAAGCTLGLIGELPVTMSSDLAPMVPVKINGTAAELVADSGSTFNILTPPTATRLGLKTNYDIHGLYLEGVTGAESAYVAKAKTFELIGVTFRDAQFIVAGAGFDADGLLGENVLGVYDAEFDLANGVIRLFKPTGCRNADLAYWGGDHPFSILDIDAIRPESMTIEGLVKVNGVQLRAQFDTGSPRTLLSRRGARLAGINLDDPRVKPGGMSGGIGHGEFPTSIAPVASFEIGNEAVKNTSLRVGDIKLGDDDMLIGADFFLSHHIFVARSQSRLYFTYNGGPVFNLETVGAKPAQAPPPATGAAGAPKDADGLSRRAAASAARGAFDNAVADYSRAIAVSPSDPELLLDRGDVYRRKGQPDLALADFTAALKLKPNDARALLEAGDLRLAGGDEKGAAIDFDAAIKLDPERRYEVAQRYVSAGRFTDAIALFDAWIAAHPKSPDLANALNNRCWARGLWGKELDAALADCDAALRLTPGDPSVLDSRGLVRLRLADLDGAIADYSASLRSTKQNPWSLYGRGVARLRKGLAAQGDADIAAAASAEPGVAERFRKLGLAPPAAPAHSSSSSASSPAASSSGGPGSKTKRSPG